jgi:AraC-like DNA-binding protein
VNKNVAVVCASHQWQDEWLCRFVRQCQLLAGSVLQDAPTAIASARELLISVPSTLTIRERIVVRSLIHEVIAQLACRHAAERDPEVAYASFRSALHQPGSAGWRAEILRLLDYLTNRRPPQREQGDARVDAALRYFHQHRRNARLRLSDVAAHVGLSRCYLTRYLKQATGIGFDAHVHRARIEEACRFLEQTTLTIKEIAVAVGYEDSSRLGRHFKRLTGMTARSYQRKIYAAGTGPQDSTTNRNIRR